MKKYIVTGATSGVGEALVKSFKGEDVQIVAIGRNEGKLEKLKAFMPSYQCITVNIDLCEVESIKEKITPYLDEVDGFVHCAGFNKLTSLRKASYDLYLKMMNVNYFSFAELVRLITLKKSKERRLRIIGISSCASVTGLKSNYIYASTKAAMDAFVRNVALDLAPQNVEINTLQPSYIDTPMLSDIKEVYGSDFGDVVLKRQGLGLISVDDMVEEIRFLLNKKSTKVSGTAIKINAGLTF